MRNTAFVFIYLLLSSTLSFGQKVKAYHPTSTTAITHNPEEAKAFDEQLAQCAEIWNRMADLGVYEEFKLTAEEEKILENCDEDNLNYWTPLTDPCSWYCAGGPAEVLATSQLPRYKGLSYLPKNAHDLNLKTAWVEGVEGFGIGEQLIYEFEPYSPRITKIKVAPGYVKSTTAWENNARPKRLEVYYNHTSIGILHLKNERSIQEFDLGTIGPKRSADGSLTYPPAPWRLSFKILDVYPGAKYTDLAISEIFFDGIDVHCLKGDTPIQLANGKTKPICQLKPGEVVLTLNRFTQRWEPDTIIAMDSAYHDHLISVRFNTNDTLTLTRDHPILMAQGQWSSHLPAKTRKDYGYQEVQQLRSGTEVKSQSPTMKRVVKIIPMQAPQWTYTITRLKNNDTFIAGGVVVGIEPLALDLSSQSE